MENESVRAGEVRETFISAADANEHDSVAPDPIEAARTQRIARVAAHIRAESRAERLVDPAVFAEKPFSLTEEELAEVWDAFATDEQYVDIVRTVDESTGVKYLHSEYLLSVAYAKLLFRKEANDPKRLVAEAVRENAEQWPRPISTEYFSGTDLFEMTADQVAEVLRDIDGDPQYADIKTVTTSTGVLYLYSDRFMEGPFAQTQAEWIEVESKDMYNQ